MGFISSLIGSHNAFQAQGATPDQIAAAQAQLGNANNAASGLAGAAGNNDAFAMQNALAGQLAQGAMGQGPNPALAQLQQTTGQNIASQAALQGSQRGIGANPGLLARQVAQQGGQLNQQAAGQAAVQQAQQQMGYQQQLQNLLGQQVGQQQNAVGLQGQLATTNQGQLLQSQSAANTANAGVAQANANTNGKIAGGIFGGLGTIAGNLFPKTAGGLAEGGMAGQTGAMATQKEHYAQGGEVITPDHIADYFCSGGYMSNGGMPPIPDATLDYYSDGKGPVVPGKAEVAGDSQKNDKIPAMLSPGEIVVPRTKAMDPAKAAAFASQVSMRAKRRHGK